MKKSILLLLTILMSISMNFYCFADNLNLDELTFVGNYDVIMQQSGNWEECYMKKKTVLCFH